VEASFVLHVFSNRSLEDDTREFQDEVMHQSFKKQLWEAELQQELASKRGSTCNPLTPAAAYPFLCLFSYLCPE